MFIFNQLKSEILQQITECKIYFLSIYSFIPTSHCSAEDSRHICSSLLLTDSVFYSAYCIMAHYKYALLFYLTLSTKFPKV